MDPAQDKYYSFLVIIILILLFPALLINIGSLPVIADEATRAIVSLEMDLSGNLITPTINGEYYFNKPPLYNWILLGIFRLTGSSSEWAIRIPAIFSLLLFGLTIYLAIKEKTGKRVAFISALVFISCGRILFYDSMLGLIDLTFSLLIFLNFIVIYEFGKRNKFLALFLISYFLTALAFLMKGLPALVFEALTLTSAMIFLRKWQKLFSLKHLGGIFLLLVLAGGYYYLLYSKNPEMRYFEVLVTESTKRTFIEHGIWKTFIHIFTFPVEQLYHLLPWSVFFIFLLDNSFYREIKKDQFLSFLAIVFLVNIPVYWISVDSYPRYIFMLYPLLLILLVNHYFSRGNPEFRKKIFWPAMMIILISAYAAGLWLFINYNFRENGSEKIIWIFTGITAVMIIMIWKFRYIRLELIVILLLVLRIGFNVAVIPERISASRRIMQKEQAINVAKISEGKELYLRPWSGISHETTYYITRERGKILRIEQGTPAPGILYIVSDRESPGKNEKILYRFETRWQNYPLRLVKYQQE